MAVIVPDAMTPAGVTPTPVVPEVTGDVFVNDGTQRVRIENSSGENRTLTIGVNETVDGITVPDRTVTLLPGVTYLGPFDPTIYNNGSSQVEFTYDTEVGLAMEVIEG